MQKATIFLSYSSDDQKTVRDLVVYLHTLHIDLKVDEDVLRPSNPIGETLRDEIQKAHGCLWVLTERSVSSAWCPVEVGAFWGAGKPVIIYNPDGIEYNGPFRDIKQARSFQDLEKAVKELKVRGSNLGNLTIQEAARFIKVGIKESIQGLSDEVALLCKHLPVITRMSEYLEIQNTFLPNHASILEKVAELIDRGPKRLACAFDVPSFGSVSAQKEYRRCTDSFDRYAVGAEWDLSIRLLPGEVGVKIVNTEFGKKLERRKLAWEEDLDALKRFQGYAKRSRQGEGRKFSIGWLAVNRDHTGAPVGLHSMPLNVWVADDREAVFSTVIDNYHPVSLEDQPDQPRVQEIGFSTRNPDMVRFLSSIMEKYGKNDDPSVCLEDQIEAAQQELSAIQELIKRTPSNQNKLENGTRKVKQ